MATEDPSPKAEEKRKDKDSSWKGIFPLLFGGLFILLFGNKKKKAPSSDYTDFLEQDFRELFKMLGLKDWQRHFLQSRWLEQVLWMEKRATQCRNRYHRLRYAAIFLGVIVPILVGIDPGNGRHRILKGIIIVFSTTAAVCSATEEFFGYGDRWYQYRRAAESLKAQGWQFFELSGPYSCYSQKESGHQKAFTSFVAQVEEIIERDIENYVIQRTQQEAAEVGGAEEAEEAEGQGS